MAALDATLERLRNGEDPRKGEDDARENGRGGKSKSRKRSKSGR